MLLKQTTSVQDEFELEVSPNQGISHRSAFTTRHSSPARHVHAPVMRKTPQCTCHACPCIQQQKLPHVPPPPSPILVRTPDSCSLKSETRSTRSDKLMSCPIHLVLELFRIKFMDSKRLLKNSNADNAIKIRVADSTSTTQYEQPSSSTDEANAN